MAWNVVLWMPLAASWVNAMLYATELSQAVRVWEELSDTRWRTKLVVAFAVLFDTIATLLVCVLVQGQYEAIPCSVLPPMLAVNGSATLSGIDDSTSLEPPVMIPWMFPAIIATTGITGLIVHTYLLRRLHILIRNYVIVLPIAVAGIVAFVGAVLTATVIARFPLLSDATRWDPFSQTWEISSACTDILLAAALIHTLWQVQSPIRATQTLIRKLIRRAVETGATTSTLFVVIVVLLLSPAYQPAAVALQLIVGRAYTITLLYNLRISQRVRSGLSRARATSSETPPSFSLSEIEFRRRTRRTEDGEARLSHLHPDLADSQARRDTPSASYAFADAYVEFPPNPRSNRAKGADAT